LNIAEIRGWAPLRVAIASGQTQAAHALVQAGANVNTPDAGNYIGGSYVYAGGVTPLMAACERGEIELAQTLIAAGADLNVVTLKSAREAVDAPAA
jgi:ankyrin repeat protein